MESNQPPQDTNLELSTKPADMQAAANGHVPAAFKKHSGPGIASFIIGLVSLLGYILSVAVAESIMSPYVQSGVTDAPDQNAVTGLGIVGLIVIILIIIDVVGLILGIVGCAIKQRKKIFAVIGLIINAMILLSVGAFFAIAATMSSSLM